MENWVRNIYMLLLKTNPPKITETVIDKNGFTWRGGIVYSTDAYIQEYINSK